MRNILLVLFLMTLIGCGGEARESTKVSDDFTVDFLFEHEGCRVYRFVDYGNERYFTNCGSTSWVESCGKNCLKEVGVG